MSGRNPRSRSRAGAVRKLLTRVAHQATDRGLTRFEIDRGRRALEGDEISTVAQWATLPSLLQHRIQLINVHEQQYYMYILWPIHALDSRLPHEADILALVSPASCLNGRLPLLYRTCLTRTCIRPPAITMTTPGHAT